MNSIYLDPPTCQQAMAAWALARANYELLSQIVMPTGLFRYTLEDCAWLQQHSEASYFYACPAILNQEMMLVIIPVGTGISDSLPTSYLCVYPTLLQEDLMLEQIRQTEEIQTTVLARETLNLLDRLHETRTSGHNEPTVGERPGIRWIQNWKYQLQQWLYFECDQWGGNRIVKRFSVPLADLTPQDPKIEEIWSFFGLRKSPVNNQMIPVLLFFGVEQVTMEGKRWAREMGNTVDFSTPCPPFCGIPPESVEAFPEILSEIAT